MGDGPYALVETHISVLLFTGGYVYKLKKPVLFDFVDFSTREEREHACHREVALNRRIAPDVYLGVVDVVAPDGSTIDHMVMMRAMPPESSLAALVSTHDPSLPLRLGEVARLISEFHDRAERGSHIDARGTRDAVLDSWEEGFTELAPFVGPMLDEATEAHVERLVHEYMAGRAELFDERIGAGCVRDGHGDLQAADVFCLEDGPRVLDCIEFDDRLRYGDVWGDIAFLAMDLERLGDSAAAGMLLDFYGGHRADRPPRSLIHHYVAMKAHIRAKVSALRAAQAVEGSDAYDGAVEVAGALLELTLAHLEAARVRLVIVGGSPGAGKSTLAAGLGTEMGMSVLRSDEIRKDLAGGASGALSPGEEVGEAFSGVYSAEMTRATYAEMLTRARQLLSMGVSVVLDASFSSTDHREAARRLARETSSAMEEIRCVVAPEIAAQRIALRLEVGTDPSDATPEIAELMAARSEPWPEATTISTDVAPERVVEAALASIRQGV